MKKFLSLMLAMIMVMSLVTVGAGAAFEDAEEIQYTEAVEVMSALGILQGYTDDTFRPQNPLTRQVAAKIIAYIALGTEKADDLICIEKPFSDVPATKTLAPYVAWIAKEGIVDGYEDGTFQPEAYVSGHAFLKMVLGALGIDGEYTGDGWRLNVTTAAAEAKLFEGIDTTAIDLRANATRELACQIAFNAMFYTESGAWYYPVTFADGTEMKFDTQEDALLYASLLDGTPGDKKQDTSDSLGAKNFNLAKDTANEGKYGRPAVVYTYGEDDEVVIEKTPVKVYENGVNAKTLHADLGYTKASDVVKLLVIEDGEEADERINIEKGDDDTTVAGKGARVEIYKESESKKFTAVVINTYVKVLTADDISEAEEATDTTDAVAAYINVFEYVADGETKTATFKTDAYEEDDVILYTKNGNKVGSVELADSETAEVEKYTSSSVTFDGKKYSYSKKAHEDTLKVYSFTAEYTFYLDAQGNVIYSVETDEDSADITDYAYITKIETKASTEGTLIGEGKDGAAVAEIILTDGTKKVVALEIYENDEDVKVIDLPKADGNMANSYEVTEDNEGAAEIGNWFAYEVNSDGTYTFSKLTGKVDVENGLTLKKGETVKIDDYYTTSKTNITAIDTKQKVSTSKGLVELALTGKVLYTYNKSAKTVTAIYAVEQAEATITDTTDYVYALSQDAVVKGGREWSVLEDGAKETYVIDETKSDKFGKGDIYTLTTTNGKTVAEKVDGVKKEQTIALVDDTFVVVGSDMIELADDFVVYNVEKKAVDTLQNGDICTFVYDAEGDLLIAYITKAK